MSDNKQAIAIYNGGIGEHVKVYDVYRDLDGEHKVKASLNGGQIHECIRYTNIKEPGGYSYFDIEHFTVPFNELVPTGV